MSTTVSRRVISIKMKKTRKPHVPMPQRSSPSGEMVGEKAKPFAGLAAAVPRSLPPRAWWEKALRPAAVALCLLVGGGFAYFMVGASSQSSYDRSAETASLSTPSSSARASRSRTQASSAYPGSEAIAENIVLSNRTAPTDDSFRATAYVRKKVSLPTSLPNISGNCVVKGNGSADIGECLRQQAER